MAVKLGDLLVKAKLVTPEQIQEALVEVQASGMKLGEALVKLGYTHVYDMDGGITSWTYGTVSGASS